MAADSRSSRADSSHPVSVDAIERIAVTSVLFLQPELTTYWRAHCFGIIRLRGLVKKTDPKKCIDSRVLLCWQLATSIPTSDMFGA